VIAGLDPGLMLTLTVVICGAIATYVTLRLNAVAKENERANAALENRIIGKLDERERAIAARMEDRDSKILLKLEELRRDFTAAFVPATLASEQRSSIMHRVQAVESDLAEMHDRWHKLRGETVQRIENDVHDLKAWRTHIERKP
jgi:seryl-tRNA(Sec) selenium transferase